MKDKLFKLLLFVCAVLVLFLAAGMVYTLVQKSVGAFRHFGVLNFIFSSDWDPRTGEESYGALSFIYGTLMTASLALLFCIPFSFPIALFTGEYFKGKPIANFVSAVINLLAGIPSIVYGLWGFYTLRPLVVSLGLNGQGFGILTASLVLAIMIIPYASSLSAEFISMVPNELKEAGYSLGATQLEVIQRVSIPAAGSGIFAAYILALGRALGETIAVTMLIGNTNNIPQSIVDTGNSMASVIANQFGEASGLKLSALVAIGLLLFCITALINSLAKIVMQGMQK